MPRLLDRIQASNETWFRKLPPKHTRVRGVIQAVDPARQPSTTFILPRLSLRVRPGEPIEPRDLLRDSRGRVLLVAQFDESEISNVFSLFQMTHRVSWSRRVTTGNPVTGRPSSPGRPEELGPVWAAIESPSGISRDSGIAVGLNRRRCITGAPLQLGDVIADQTVKHLNNTLGITVAEIE